MPTVRPTDGVDVYFEMPSDDSEHANFLRAKMDLEERRMKRINEVSLMWSCGVQFCSWTHGSFNDSIDLYDSEMFVFAGSDHEGVGRGR